MQPSEFRAHRVAFGITQLAMADVLAVSVTYVRAMEHGRRPITPKLAARLTFLAEQHRRMTEAEGEAAALRKLIESKEWLYSERGESPWLSQVEGASGKAGP